MNSNEPKSTKRPSIASTDNCQRCLQDPTIIPSSSNNKKLIANGYAVLGAMIQDVLDIIDDDEFTDDWDDIEEKRKDARE